MRERLKRALLALVSSLLALALGEAAVRALDVTEPILREADRVLSWRPIAGARGWCTREGRAWVRISEQGFRGVDVAPGSPREGTLRVALIGDSFVEARQVALSDTVGARLEQRLSSALAGPVEVLAFGVSGYGPAQEYLLYRERVRAYHPHVVVLAMFTANDVSDSAPATHGGDDPPYFSVGPGDALVLDDSFVRSPHFLARERDDGWHWLRRRSELARTLHAIGSIHDAHADVGETGLRDAIYAEPDDAAWQDAWTRTEAIVRHLATDVREDGARFVLVTLSSAIQVDPDPARRAEYARRIAGEDLLYPERRMAAAASRDGYEILALAPRLRAYAEEHHAYLHGFTNTALGTGHWNEEGHRVAAMEIARGLVSE